MKETLDTVERAETTTEKLILGYQREYQRKYRERNRFHYGWVQWNRLHPDNQITLEQYITYRQNKERMKEIKEKE